MLLAASAQVYPWISAPHPILRAKDDFALSGVPLDYSATFTIFLAG
jgi:hypothetical protein